MARVFSRVRGWFHKLQVGVKWNRGIREGEMRTEKTQKAILICTLVIVRFFTVSWLPK
jgi:hypothetical protein